MTDVWSEAKPSGPAHEIPAVLQHILRFLCAFFGRKKIFYLEQFKKKQFFTINPCLTSGSLKEDARIEATS